MNGLRIAARVSRVAVGLVLIVSGAVKVWEPVLFYWEAVPYTQLLGLTNLWREIAILAVALAPFECALGVALAASWRPRWTLPVAAALLVFFLGLTTYAWIDGATEDCGCFGSLVQRSPGEAAVEDAVLVVVLAFGWWFGRGSVAIRGSRWFVLGVAVLSIGLTAARFLPEVERLDKSDLLPGVRLTGLEVQGVPHDLQRGTYLVELMSPRCPHCLDAIPKLNQLTEVPDLPRLVALTSFAQDSEQMVEFRREQETRYPVGSVSRTDFFRLTWKHGYPRLALIRDGVVQQVWERDQFPTAEAIRAAAAQP
ncbi:MAG: MauE/DoxX family redox-associated membrane protein [Candidatus Latescibacterota bacterium]|jgi:hypothetical protein